MLSNSSPRSCTVTDASWLSVIQSTLNDAVRLCKTWYRAVLRIQTLSIRFRIRILLFTLIPIRTRIRILSFNLIQIRIRLFDTDPDPDPYRFKEVMYLKRYFLYIFTSFPLSVSPTGLTQKVFFVKFSLPVNSLWICILDTRGADPDLDPGK